MDKDEIVIDEILIAAKSLFGSFGLKKTTIEDISLASGKGKSTLYNYFPGKNEIFEAVVRNEMKTVVRSLQEGVNLANGAKAKLKAFLNVQSTAIVQLRSLHKVLFEDLIEARRILLPLRSAYEQKQIEMIGEILRGGMQSGDLKVYDDERIRKVSLLIIFAFKGLHYPLSINPGEVKSHEYFDELVDILLEGIGN